MRVPLAARPTATAALQPLTEPAATLPGAPTSVETQLELKREYNTRKSKGGGGAE